jgi:DNA-directed RNA polymerase subunit N (RpoN/RPB10)
MEINDSMLRVSSERDLQKEALDSITDKLGVDKKIVRRMARTYYKANFNAEVEDNNTFEEFYQTVINGSTNG